MLAAWLKQHFRLVWWMLFAAAAVPAMWLAGAYWRHGLGENPLEAMLHTTGKAAMIMLIFTLVITPLRRSLTLLSKQIHARYGKRLSDWNWLVRLRRLFGLWCSAYALVHCWLFLEFDLGYDWDAIMLEVREKPYLLAGAFAVLLLFPLAATSTRGMMKRLGKHWFTLHTLTYAVAVLGLLHFWWLVKPGDWRPMPYTIAIGALFGYRLLLRMGLLRPWSGSNGLEAPERQTGFPATATGEIGRG